MGGNRAFSVLGLFDSAQILMNAIPSVKGKVMGRLEAYTPHPIHGFDEALGFRKSPIGGMVFVMGIIGAISAIAFELWTGGIDYPLITAAKPHFSWEAFVPIVFEVTVLFACFASGLGMLLLLNRLPLYRHPMLRSASLPLLTRDTYGLAVESEGNERDAEKIAAALREAGAKAVEVIEALAPPSPASPQFFAYVLAMIIIACTVAGYLTYWGTKLFPVTIPMAHMLDQPRLDPQRPSGFFKDGFGMRMPVPETVMRGSIPYTIGTEEDAGILANPLPRTESLLRRGQQIFKNHCAVCHGILGNGATSLTAAYGAKPANLVSQKMIDLPDGKVHHVIIMGKNTMPSYATDLNDDERWAAAHYVRVLQRAMNAKDEDIPNKVTN
jgi:mono/diheme cytochrome c family protein